MNFSRITIAVIFCTALFIGLSQTGQKKPGREDFILHYEKAERLYKEGEKIVTRPDYTEAKEKKLNEDALQAFRNLDKEMTSSSVRFDSLSFFVNLKIGVLEHYFENNQAAKTAYTKAIDLKKNLPALSDSFLFKPFLYLGIILYNENLFDLSLNIYKRAEKIAADYPHPLEETERLYNTLGALYYETGNYRQAKNYTEKSLAVISPSNPYYKDLVINYKINLASILTRLEEYDEANSIYQEILPLNINRDIILHNTGVINLKLGAIQKAIDYFRKVNYTDARKVRLYNDMATAFMNLHQNDSARFYLDAASSIDTFVSNKTVSRGQTHQQKADLLVSENKPDEALPYYQTAIQCFYPGFAGNDIYKNPEHFSGVFSYIHLFNTLVSKAAAFEILFHQQKKTTYLQASLDAYSSAFLLADYVEKSYDSDEARLFLNRIKYGVHSQPIDVSLQLFEITKDKAYLEKAWQFDQKNKASILSYNVSENERRQQENQPAIYEREKEIKSAITRLSLKAAQITDADKQKELGNTIRDYEIELGKIEEKLAGPGNNRFTFHAIPSVLQLQNNLLDKKTVLLSYHLSEKDLLILCISRQQFFYRKITLLPEFYPTIDSLIRNLHDVKSDNKFSGQRISRRLYQWLIKPVLPGLQDMERLVIIPDDELLHIPYEALQDENGGYLAEQFSVQYQYTVSLLEKKRKKYAIGGILSFAPYADQPGSRFAQLSGSGDEIKSLKGLSFINQSASKENFLQQVNKFSIIHLATHAQVSDNRPMESFIAFAENNRDSMQNRLYEQEIYNLKLDSTKLVILSACETGSGQLVHGEGMMSLSRAFAYAGCPDIVTSLWKAEDKTTAFLMSRLQYYLQQKQTIDRALQKAKLDLIKSSEIDQRLKTPNYWAHMIFIGGYEPEPSFTFKWWFVIPALLPFIFVFIYLKRRKQVSPFSSSPGRHGKY